MQPCYHQNTNFLDAESAPNSSNIPHSKFATAGNSHSFTAKAWAARYKRELCRSVAKGKKCHYGRWCMFAHSQDELRLSAPGAPANVAPSTPPHPENKQLSSPSSSLLYQQESNSRAAVQPQHQQHSMLGTVESSLAPPLTTGYVAVDGSYHQQQAQVHHVHQPPLQSPMPLPTQYHHQYQSSGQLQVPIYPTQREPVTVHQDPLFNFFATPEENSFALPVQSHCAHVQAPHLPGGPAGVLLSTRSSIMADHDVVVNIPSDHYSPGSSTTTHPPHSSLSSSSLDVPPSAPTRRQFRPSQRQIAADERRAKEMKPGV